MAQNVDPVPSPDFGIFARVLIESAVKKVQVAYPAIVTAYYPPNPVTKDPAMVDVQVARKYARQIDHLEDALPTETTREDAEYGLLATADITPVPRVVVQYPGFAGMRITGPLAVGEGLGEVVLRVRQPRPDALRHVHTGLQHGGAGVILGSDQFHLVLLAAQLALH